MELYVKDVLFEGIKDEKEKISLLNLRHAIHIFPKTIEFQPLLENDFTIKEMCLKNIVGMFSLYEKLKEILTDDKRNRILVASERYVYFAISKRSTLCARSLDRSGRTTRYRITTGATLTFPAVLFGFKTF